VSRYFNGLGTILSFENLIKPVPGNDLSNLTSQKGFIIDNHGTPHSI